MRFLSISILFLVCRMALAASPHPFSVEDLLAFDRISEPRVSPDGSSVVFTVQTPDIEANKGKKDLWLASTSEAKPRRLTSHPSSDYNPCWAPDGKSILFLSERSGSSQVWRIPVDGGEAVQVTDLPLDVGNLVVSRDGKRIAFSMDVFVGTTYEKTKERMDEEAKKKASGRIYDTLFVRHWDQWADGRRSHLFVMASSGTGKPVDIMKSMDADAPSRPFGGTEEFTFTPDGEELVFTARNVGPKEAWSTNFDLYRAPVDGSKAPDSLTRKNEAWDSQPVFSPDGKTLAYLAMSRPGYESDRFRIVLRPWPHGAERVLAEKWDRSPSTMVWSPDGKALLATAWNVGQCSLFSIDAATGEARELRREGHADSPTAAGDRVFFTLDDLKTPAELWTVRTDGTDARPITALNAKKLAAVRMGETEQFSFKGANGDTVYAYVVKPPLSDRSKKYPVALLIHGGPQGSMSNDFHYRWNPQIFAGAGYGAIAIDFHGSTGYGQAFTDAIRGDWGGKPLEDLQKGLEAALARYPWLDGTRAGALGASYGGYMINWIAGNWPDRFRCLVAHDGNLDERAAYFDTEELWFPEWEHHGTPWNNPEGYEKQNPVNFVKNWKTPMLVIHGGRDFRVVETQGLSTFNTLQRLGIPSKLLYFPDENHWVLKPQNSLLWHKTVIGWLDRWLKGNDPGASRSHR